MVVHGSTIGKTNSYNDFDWDLTDNGNRKLISGTKKNGDRMGWQLGYKNQVAQTIANYTEDVGT